MVTRMGTSSGQRKHLVDHYREVFPSGARVMQETEDIRYAWDRKEVAEIKRGVEPYTREDVWLDQIEQLPSEEQVHILLGLLRAPELREIAAGIINDSAVACKVGDSLEVAKAINGWIATAEELATSRRKLRYILAARQRQRRLRD